MTAPVEGGARQPSPRRIDVPVVTPESDARRLVQGALARSVDQVLRHEAAAGRGEPHDVHQLRVATRRLRSDLRTFGPLLVAERVAPLRGELAWLGQEIGAVRDLDVLIAHLAPDVGELPPDDAPAAGELVGCLERERAEARAALAATLAGERYRRLREALPALAGEPPMADGVGAQRAADRVVRLVRGPWRRLRAAVRDLPRNPSDAALHRVRIRAKRCRYAAEAVSPVAGDGARRFAAAVADVQTVLGDHQDTVVAEEALRRLAESRPELAAVAGELIARQRDLRARLRERWPAVWEAAAAGTLRAWMRSGSTSGGGGDRTGPAQPEEPATGRPGPRN